MERLENLILQNHLNGLESYTRGYPGMFDIVYRALGITTKECLSIFKKSRSGDWSIHHFKIDTKEFFTISNSEDHYLLHTDDFYGIPMIHGICDEDLSRLVMKDVEWASIVGRYIYFNPLANLQSKKCRYKLSLKRLNRLEEPFKEAEETRLKAKNLFESVTY